MPSVSNVSSISISPPSPRQVPSRVETTIGLAPAASSCSSTGASEAWSWPSATSTATFRVAGGSLLPLHGQRRGDTRCGRAASGPRRRGGRALEVGQVAGDLVDADALGDAAGQVLVDVEEQVAHPLADVEVVDLPELELPGAHDVPLLRVGLAVPEQRRLGEVIVEGLAAVAHLLPRHLLRVAAEAVRARHRASAAEAVGLVVHPSRVDRLAHVAVALVVVRPRRGAG